MRELYKEISFKESSLFLINCVNQVIDEYEQMGYSLTLRQVYYQLVARAIIPNNERSYKNLGNLISDGRIAGLIDWNAIEDRTRNLRENPHWAQPDEIIQSAANQFALNKWEGQAYYVEVWVEKDALVGVVGQACQRLDVPFFSCRGYVSQSEMYSAAKRFIRMGSRFEGQQPVILHLGDHDPSGRDMSRDIQDRLETFGADIEFKRIALNMDQIELYDPPPNPAKITDSRSSGYIERFGYESWELDALRPDVIEQLIEEEVRKFLDVDLFKAASNEEKQHRELLRRASQRWVDIVNLLNSEE